MGNIDFRAREMLIEGGNVNDDETDTSKTSESPQQHLCPPRAGLGIEKVGAIPASEEKPGATGRH